MICGMLWRIEAKIIQTFIGNPDYKNVIVFMNLPMENEKGIQFFNELFLPLFLTDHFAVSMLWLMFTELLH